MFNVPRKIATTIATVAAAAAVGTGVAIAVGNGGDQGGSDVVTLVGADPAEAGATETTAPTAEATILPATADPAATGIDLPTSVATSDSSSGSATASAPKAPAGNSSTSSTSTKSTVKPRTVTGMTTEKDTEPAPAPEPPAPDDPVRQTAPPPIPGSESHILPVDPDDEVHPQP